MKALEKCKIESLVIDCINFGTSFTTLPTDITALKFRNCDRDSSEALVLGLAVQKSKVEVLDISCQNDDTSAVLRLLSHLTNLKKLVLADAILDRNVKHLNQITQLVEVDFIRCRFTGSARQTIEDSKLRVAFFNST
jgi:hypothetical protein